MNRCALLPAAYTTCHAEAQQRRMVTFTRIPYVEAAQRARRQDCIVYASLIALLILIVGMLTLLFRSIGR